MNTPEEKQSNRKDRKVGRSFINILNGSFLTKKDAINHLPFLLFLTLLALIYIANGYYAESTIRKLNQTNNELKELQSEYITTKANLMFKSKQSEVEKIVEEKNLGLKASVVPPKKVVVNEGEWEQ